MKKIKIKVNGKIRSISEINKLSDLIKHLKIPLKKLKKKYQLKRKKQTEKDPNIVDLEKELSDKIGLKTEIEFSDNGSSGSLKLYYSFSIYIR